MLKTSKPRRVPVTRAYTPEDDDQLLAELRADNFYDCWELQDDTRFSHKLFSSRNIGDASRTNLQVPGQLYSTFVCTNWYARTNITHPDLKRELEGFAHQAQATMVIGSKIRWRASIYDLLRSWSNEGGHRDKRPLWPILIPERHNLEVVVDAYGDNYGFIANLQSEYSGWSRCERRIWIHLEGVTIPRFHSNEGDDDEAAAAQAHYDHFVGRVMRLLTRSEKEVASTEEHIARWLGLLVTEADNPADKLRLEAIADGIREQRYMTDKDRR